MFSPSDDETHDPGHLFCRARIRQLAEAAQRWQSMGRGHIYTRDEGREPFIFFYFVL